MQVQNQMVAGHGLALMTLLPFHVLAMQSKGAAGREGAAAAEH